MDIFEKVKDLKNVKVGPYAVLCKMENISNSKIITPDSVKDKMQGQYGVAVIVGSEIHDIDPGDVILDFTAGKYSGFELGETKYVLFNRSAISMHTTMDNLSLNDNPLQA
jgi:hypothetical protein